MESESRMRKQWIIFVLTAVLLVAVGCGQKSNRSSGVYMLLDTSGTYAVELKKAQAIINYLLGLGKFVWLSNADVALLAIAITDIWMWSPFVMLLSLAGLSAIPQHLYEAAAIDRASRWFTFSRITLPLVIPLLLIAVIFRTLEAFKTFDLAFIMTGGGPGTATELIAIKLYNMAFPQWQTGKSCALAYILLVMIIGISNIYIKYLNKAKER